MTRRALIGDGGILRRVEARCHLTQIKAQIAVAITITWAPLMASAMVMELVIGARIELIHDAATHVRLLVATPMLLFLDGVFPITCTHVADQLVRDAFIRTNDHPRYERLVERTRRLCEWSLPELVIFVMAMVLAASTLTTTDRLHGIGLRGGLTFVDWWYAIVALSLFEFLLYRSLWRWILWLRFLVGLVRINLDLDATHPDLRCGILFLRNPSLAYCALLMFTLSAVLSGGWSDRFQASTVTAFIPLLLVLAAAAILLAFGPLLLFAFQLQRARFAARHALGSVAVHNDRWFRDRWMGREAGGVIESNDVQSLAALANTYQSTVKKVSLVLFERNDLLIVLLATLLPVIPTMLVRIPEHEWRAMASFLVSTSGIP